jgi:hypothetical protein
MQGVNESKLPLEFVLNLLAIDHARTSRIRVHSNASLRVSFSTAMFLILFRGRLPVDLDDLECHEWLVEYTAHE